MMIENRDEILVVVIVVSIVGEFVQAVRLPELRGRQRRRIWLFQQLGIQLERQTEYQPGGPVVRPARNLQQPTAAIAPSVPAGFVAVAEPFRIDVVRELLLLVLVGRGLLQRREALGPDRHQSLGRVVQFLGEPPALGGLAGYLRQKCGCALG